MRRVPCASSYRGAAPWAATRINTAPPTATASSANATTVSGTPSAGTSRVRAGVAAGACRPPRRWRRVPRRGRASRRSQPWSAAPEERTREDPGAERSRRGAARRSRQLVGHQLAERERGEEPDRHTRAEKGGTAAGLPSWSRPRRAPHATRAGAVIERRPATTPMRNARIAMVGVGMVRVPRTVRHLSSRSPRHRLRSIRPQGASRRCRACPKSAYTAVSDCAEHDEDKADRGQLDQHSERYPKPAGDRLAEEAGEPG